MNRSTTWKEDVTEQYLQAKTPRDTETFQDFPNAFCIRTSSRPIHNVIY